MARTTKPLTNTEVKHAKPSVKEYSLSDGNGLALRVKPNGSKLWIFNYFRPHTKKRANIGFGAYPEVSLAAARKRRNGARELLSQDIDPKEEKDKQDAASRVAHNNTLEHIATQWFEVKKTQITAGYADDIWRSFQLHIFPTLGKLPLHKLTAPKTIDTLKPIAAKGSLETVKRLSQRLNEVMVFAVNTGLLDANPLAGISKAFQTPKKRNQPALKPDELPELLAALQNANMRTTTRCLILWQLHTMTRPSEASSAKWSEIDLEKNLWNIPAERMKKRRPHTIPLAPQVIALLARMKPISSSSPYIFPADRSHHQPANPQTANAALKRMGFGGRLVAHGMRSMASTMLNEQGFNPDVIEAALAHIDSNEVRAAYNRAEYLEKRKTMMCWWSGHIEQAASRI